MKVAYVFRNDMSATLSASLDDPAAIRAGYAWC